MEIFHSTNIIHTVTLKNVVLQDELIGMSTNEELKVLKQISAVPELTSERHTCYLFCIMVHRENVFDSFSVIIARGKRF